MALERACPELPSLPENQKTFAGIPEAPFVVRSEILTSNNYADFFLPFLKIHK